MVSIIEMMGAAKNYATGTQRFMETYIVAALIYWIVCIGFDSLFAVIEGNTGKYRRTIAQ
jgi:ABC-type amino acid transport system permease subunit